MQGGPRKACGALTSARRRSHIDGVVTILIQPKPLPPLLRVNRRSGGGTPHRPQGRLLHYHASQRAQYVKLSRGPGKSYSDVIMRWRGPGSGPLFSCVERRNKDRVAESIRVCAQRPPLEVRTCAPHRSLFCGAIATFDALKRQLSCSLLTIRVLELPRELGDLKRCIFRSR